MRRIETHRFDNGLVLATETGGSARSAAFSARLPMGSARDPEGKEGLCAVVEELLLRGSEGLDSRAQADAFDALGASRGTSTSSFFTGVSAVSMGERMGEVLPLVMEMVRRPRMDGGGFEASRDLCVQFVRALPDDPAERLRHALRARHAPSPIDKPDIGTEAGLLGLGREDCVERWGRCAVPGGAYMAVAGAVDHGALVEELGGLMEGWEGEGEAVSFDASGGERGYGHVEQATNQTHIGVAFDGPSEGEEASVLERVVVGVLSGGMSGRLFTEVREKRGLCYSVGARYASSRDFGRVTAYVGTTPERAQESLDVLLGELRRPLEDPSGVTDEEIDRAKVGLKARVVMSGESTRARAVALASDLFRVGTARSLEAHVERIEGVTAGDVRGYLSGRSLGRMSVVTVGPVALDVGAGLLGV